MAKARTHQKKHGISFEEAKSVFYDEYSIQFYDDDSHSQLKEDRFLLLGYSSEQRLLLVYHCETHAGNSIRIISARRATKNEAKHYSGGKNER